MSERVKRWRENNPVRYAYLNLKHNAKRRGHEFDITLDEFRQFCTKCEYIDRKGIRKDSYHIDRIDETKGYTLSNIQLLRNSDNVRKYIDFIHTEKGREYFVRKSNEMEGIDDCPF